MLKIGPYKLRGAVAFYCTGGSNAQLQILSDQSISISLHSLSFNLTQDQSPASSSPTILNPSSTPAIL